MPKIMPKTTANLNEAQIKAVTFGSGPLLIVAGAGTGKTTVITRRIVSLISQDIKPDEILALTFTDKAANEMEERADLLLPYGYYDLWISTFHSFCERILKQHALDIGIPNDFKVLDSIQQKILVRKNLDLFDLDYYRPLGNPTKFISDLVKHFSKAKDEEISPQDYLQYAKKAQLDGDNPDFADEDEVKRINEIAGAYHLYQKLLLDNNSLDFGDLINYCLKLFRTRKKILSFYQGKFKYILVDEFQDTNFAQYELVKLLAAPKNNLNVVGDDDQSIYKFRGASVSNILQFKKDYPSAVEIALTENYRSCQNILDLAYNFIQRNSPERLEDQLHISKKLKARSQEQGTIEVLSGQTLSDEVDMVVKKILQLKKPARENSSWNDFAVLVRANDQADAFISKFSALGLPFTYFAHKGLYKKPIILDLIYYLRVLLNFHDNAGLYKILNFDLFKVDHTDIVNILHFANKKTLSVYEVLHIAAAVPNLKPENLLKIGELLATLQKHSQLAGQKNVAEVFITVVKDLRIAKRIEEDTLENMENREILEQFYRKIEEFEAENHDKSVRNFLEALDFEQEAGEEGRLNFDPNAGPESIKIMTVHSAKGLEFTNVFIVNLVQLRFPSMDRKDPIEIPEALVKEILPQGDVHIQEERRLFYVAMTRAKKGLFFSYANDYGGKLARKPSPFLVDLGLVAKPAKSPDALKKEKNVQHDYDRSIFLPDTFSFTQITDFERCPMRYKYRHLLRLPLPGNADLSFGSSIHLTLEAFLKRYKTNLEMTQLDLFDKKSKPELPTFQELSDIYDQKWIDEWYETKAQKQKFREQRGKKILKLFYQRFVQEPIAPKYLEKSFRLKLGDYFFTGKIDRADLKDNLLHIIDYKTGQSRLENNKDGKRQLLIYQWAAEEFLKERVGSLLYWYLLDDVYSENFLGSDQDLSDLKAGLLEVIEKIRFAAASNNFKELDRKSPIHNCEFQELD